MSNFHEILVYDMFSFILAHELRKIVEEPLLRVIHRFFTIETKLLPTCLE